LLLEIPSGKRKAIWVGLAQLGSKPLLLERLQGKGKQRERNSYPALSVLT